MWGNDDMQRPTNISLQQLKIGFERTPSVLTYMSTPNSTFDDSIGRFELLFINYTNSTMLYNRVPLNNCVDDPNLICVPTNLNLTVSGDLTSGSGNYSFYVLQYRPCQSYDDINKLSTQSQQIAWMQNRSISSTEL